MPTNTKPTIPKIKVIGVGGAGCNAVSFLHQEQIHNVQLITCNTDAEALAKSPIPDKLLLNFVSTKEDAGAGDPEKGKAAALNNLQDIKAMLNDGTDIVFVVAGMGGSAGTGAAPVVAETAKQLGILTVGIVMIPFSFEGENKASTAAAGVEEMRKSTDSLLMLANDNLQVHNRELLVKDAFNVIDQFIADTVRAVADILNVPAEVNVDIEDIRLVLASAGTALVGAAVTSGKNRAQLAAQESVNFKMLVKKNMQGAQKVLLSIMSGEQTELEMDELTEITEYIQEQAGLGAEVILGHGIDPALNSSIRVTVIATGFSDN